MNEDEIIRKIGTHETEQKKNADEIERKIENIKEGKWMKMGQKGKWKKYEPGRKMNEDEIGKKN